MTPSNQSIKCVGAIVHDGRGRLLLVQRGHEPGLGLWSVPGGRVEAGETEVEAIVREVAEETGLRVRPDRLLGRVLRDGPPGTVLDIADFACAMAGGSIRAGDDAADVIWADADTYARLDVVPGLTAALAEWNALPH